MAANIEAIPPEPGPDADASGDDAAAAARPALIPCTDPATGEHLGDIPVVTPEGVHLAITRAREAQKVWGKTSFSERRRVLRLLLDKLLAEADDLVEVTVRDCGKTRENAMLGEIWPLAEKIRWTMRHGPKHLKPERRSPGMIMHKKASVRFEPLGVIGVITPWNYPLQNIFGPVIPALMAGNAAVVKVSEWVAWSSQRYQRLMDEVLDEAGYSRDLVAIVNGWADTGRALVKGGVDKIVFTGSMPNGRSIMADAAETLTPVILELGGKDSMIVCDDAHLEQAVHAALAGVLIHCGQNCLAAERMLVFDGIYDRFEARLVEMVSPLRQGAPLAGQTVDVAAIVSPLQLALIERLVNEAVAQGARVLAGGKRAGGPDSPGQFFEPTILADVTADMAIMNEEVFGPVMVLCRVSGEEEALAITNGTDFGLGCTILTRDRKRAKRMLAQVVTGGVSINDFALTYMSQALPFGGAKGSGIGRLNGREGLRAMTNIKAVLEDRLPMHMPAVLYPVGERDYDRARDVIRAIYSRGIGARLGAMFRALKSFVGGG